MRCMAASRSACSGASRVGISGASSAAAFSFSAHRRREPPEQVARNDGSEVEPRQRLGNADQLVAPPFPRWCAVARSNQLPGVERVEIGAQHVEVAIGHGVRSASR